MDHKDLLNSVIQNMTAQGVEDIPEIPNDDTMARAIPLTLSIGEDEGEQKGYINYLVDYESYDWEDGVKKIPVMIENINGIRNIMRSLCAYAHGIIPEHMKDMNLPKKAIEEFTKYFQMYQIDIDYHDYFKAVGDVDKDKAELAIAMLMGFDALSITDVMKENVTNYQTLTVMQFAYEGIDKIAHDNEEAIADVEDTDIVTPKEETCGESEPSEKKTFYVTGEFKEHVNDDGERYMAFDHISTIEEVDYTAPDEQYVPEIKSVGNTVLTIGSVMMAYDLAGCKRVAEDIFNKLADAGEVPLPEDVDTGDTEGEEEHFMSSSDLLREFGFDDHSVSGLLD